MTRVPRPAAAPAPRRPRRGVSLLELVAVTTLLGIFAAVVVARTDGTFGDAAARRDAETYSALCHAARRRAILTGHTCGVRFEKTGGDVDRFVLAEWPGGVETDLDEAFTPSGGVRAVSSAPHARWGFDGLPPSGSVNVEFRGPHRAFSVWRTGATGTLRIVETTP